MPPTREAVGTGGRSQTPDVDHRLVFESSPDVHLLLTPGLDIVAVGDAYLRATATLREDLIGRSVFDALPSGPDDPMHDAAASFERVIGTLQPDARLGSGRLDRAAHRRLHAPRLARGDQ
jgi:PAS domain-containing protein